jgi:hypothetical protein
MNITQAKERILLSDFLERLGYAHAYERHGEHWYHSPLPGRKDATPSFKTDRTNKKWFDQGSGEGGMIIELAMRMFDCDERGALSQINNLYQNATPDPVSHAEHYLLASAHKTSIVSSTHDSLEEERTEVEILPITSRGLYWYLHHRGIDPKIAKHYVQEIRYESKGKAFYALAFPSGEGGYELRNGVGVTEGKPGFKGAHGPKAITVLHAEKAIFGGTVSVFEGFFDFLSALSYYGKTEPSAPVIVMNSTSMHEQTAIGIRQLQAGKAYLYLDRDETGRETANHLRLALPEVVMEDQSQLYASYMDFNEFWMKEGKLVQMKDTHRNVA